MSIGQNRKNSMGLIQLIIWNSTEAEQRAKILREFGYDVSWKLPQGPTFLRELAKNPPAAIVIDLSRIPSQGRDVALALRSRKATRMATLIFVGGDDSKKEGIRKLLPDAVFTSWADIQAALKKALAHPLRNPSKPPSVLAGYSGTPLPKKLGIRAGYVVGVANSPPGFREILGELAEGVRLQSHDRLDCNLIIWFVRSANELSLEIGRFAKRTDYKSIWIAWPKKSSGIVTDLSEKTVRETGLTAGLVDYKICAIDAVWSGLLFTRRKGPSANP